MKELKTETSTQKLFWDCENEIADRLAGKPGNRQLFHGPEQTRLPDPIIYGSAKSDPVATYVQR